MIFSEKEIITMLKKSLPKTDYKTMENVAKSLISEPQQWQEIDLNEHIHDEVETKILLDICKRKTNNRPPKGIRLFYKE